MGLDSTAASATQRERPILVKAIHFQGVCDDGDCDCFFTNGIINSPHITQSNALVTLLPIFSNTFQVLMVARWLSRWYKS